nr:cytochrome c family protein [uncultured Desulfobacter sp.]
MRFQFMTALITALFFSISWPVFAEEKKFVGINACRDCHEEQYDTFMKYSKKADSFLEIKKMEKSLTSEEYAECFECHTTGYGKPGGFVSESQTPDLKNPGCEVCHGPGSVHVETEDPDDIITEITMDHCVVCHDKGRIDEFNFTPLVYSGAH